MDLPRLAWPLSLIWMLAATIAALLIDGPAHAFLQVLIPILLLVAAALLLVGAVARARARTTIPPAQAGAWLVGILALSSSFLWLLSRWSVLEESGQAPTWAGQASMALMLITFTICLMLLSDLTIGLVHAAAPSPTIFDWSAAGGLAGAVAMLLLTWLVVMPDPTSNDLLFSTMPAGLAMLAIAGVALAASWMARQWISREESA